MDTASMSPSGPAAPVGAIPPGAGDGDVAARPSRRSRLLRFAVLALIWLLTTLVVGSALFFSSERSTELAGHDAVVRPTLDRHAVLATGPVLPDVRIGIDSPLGVEITLGKTDAASTEELVSRYALIVSNPEAQADKVVDLVVGMAGVAYLRGAAVGLVPVLLYVLLGPAGRAGIRRDVHTLRPRVLVAGLLVVAIVTAGWQPWRDDDAQVAEQGDWTRLDDYVGDEVDLPDEAGVVELRANAATDGSKKLVDSVVDTWAKSQVFYDKAAEEAKNLNLLPSIEPRSPRRVGRAGRRADDLHFAELAFSPLLESGEDESERRRRDQFAAVARQRPAQSRRIARKADLQASVG